MTFVVSKIFVIGSGFAPQHSPRKFQKQRCGHLWHSGAVALIYEVG